MSDSKCSFGLLSKITFFFLLILTLLKNIFTILFHHILPSYRQIHNSILPELFIFISKEMLEGLFAVFQRIEFFSISEFCKNWNNVNSKLQYLVNTEDEWRLFDQKNNNFCLITNETCRLVFSWWNLMIFLLILSVFH